MPPSRRRTDQGRNRKRLLLDKMTKALTPVARVLLGDLTVALRKQGAAASDAHLLAGLLADGIGRNPACATIAERFTDAAGLRILSHHRSPVGSPEFVLTIALACDSWTRQLRQALGTPLSPTLEVQLLGSRNGVGASRLLGLDDLDAGDLEQAHLVFQTYWLENLASIATPTTGLRHAART